MGVRFEILGPVRAYRDAAPVDLGPPKQQALLALLLLNAGRPVPLPQIIAALWNGDPPPNATDAVYRFIGGLRRALGPSVITLTDTGYVVNPAENALDATAFKAAAASGDATRAAALWQGNPLSGLTGPVFESARTHLNEERARLTTQPPTAPARSAAASSREEPAAFPRPEPASTRAEPSAFTRADPGAFMGAEPAAYARAEPVGPGAAQPSPIALRRTEHAPGRGNPTHLEPLPSHPGSAEPPPLDPARVERPALDPTRVESARLDPTRAESARLDPTRAESARLDPTRAESARLESIRVESARLGSTPVEPSRSEATRVERPQAQSNGESRAEPSYAEPVDPWDGHDLFPPTIP
ncbi:winged helix-turn-helix domain-containing protein [Actinoplanes sp. NPDC048988]|uniref:AfsR/SARP family transcriptional regulator n=1 Tax=Actinoplanes sp. NPDC048988 TaxID=3363901 RepID=UPI003719F937